MSTRTYKFSLHVYSICNSKNKSLIFILNRYEINVLLNDIISWLIFVRDDWNY